MNAIGAPGRWLVLLVACACASACSDPEARTQVMLEIDADAAVRVRLETLRILIDVSDDEGKSWEKRLTRSYDAGDVGGWREFEWPARLGLVPEGDRVERNFAVRVQALDADGELYVWQQAVAGFTRGRTKLLAMSLIDECTIAALQCGQASCVGTAGCKTCRAGNCVDVELLADLPDYDPDATGTIFDGGTTPERDGGARDGSRDDRDSSADGALSAEDAGDAMAIGDGGNAASDASAAAFTVSSSSPAASAPVLEDSYALLEVGFSAPVGASTVTAESFSVTFDGRPVEGTITVTARGASFKAAGPWVLAGAYTLSLSAAIEDSEGHALAPFQLDFQARDGAWSRQAQFDGLGDPVLALASDGYGVIAWTREPAPSTTEVVASRFAPLAGWKAPELLSNAGVSASVVAINTRHDAVAVWSGISAGQTASVFTTGPSWSPAASVSPGDEPAVFLSASDELFFVAANVANGRALDGFRFTLGAASPAVFSIAASSAGNSHPQIAMVADQALLVWQHTEAGATASQIMAGRFDASAGAQISSSGADATSPRVAFNASQSAAVAVWQEVHPSLPGVSRVWASYLEPMAAGGAAPAVLDWAAAVAVSKGATSASNPVVAIDDHDRVLAAWTQDGAIIGASFTRAAGWSEPASISAAGATNPEMARIALTPSGHGLAVWAQDSANSINEVWAARYLADQGWLTRTRISDIEAGSSNLASLAIDDAGRALCAWYQSNKVWLARFE